MAKLLKFFIAVLVLAALVAGGYYWLQSRKSDDNGFELVEVTRGDITEKAVAIGQIEPRLEFVVKSKISGIVKRVGVEVGDSVLPGAMLFEIRPDPTPSEIVEAENRLSSAEAAHRRAKAEWARAQELTREGVTAEEFQDLKRESFELAEIEVASARDNLDLVRKGRVDGRGREMESILRAPAAGIVLQRMVEEKVTGSGSSLWISYLSFSSLPIDLQLLF